VQQDAGSGFEGWKEQTCRWLCSQIAAARLPGGRTVWVTRARPRSIGIACPGLIRRFGDRVRWFRSWRLLKSLPSRALQGLNRFYIENVF